MHTLVTTAQVFVFLLLCTLSYSQVNLDVEGKAKISVMDTDSTTDDLVVRQSDGTLAVRNSSTLSSPWYLGQDTLGGIVYCIYKGADGMDHGLIVSKIETTAQWQSTNSVTNGTRSWDGEYNYNLMTNSPIITWIDANFTSEWYLPPLDEMSLLWHNRFHVNTGLHAGGHTLLSKDQILYWTSTESNLDRAWCFTPKFGYVTGELQKSDTHSVRPIKKF